MPGDRRTIWTYYLFKATTSYGFIVPFSVIYLRHQGYGLDVIGVTQSAFLLAAVAMEIPAGYIADRFGRRTSLGIGNALTALVMLGYPVVDSATVWVLLYVLWGVAWAFHSAIGDAWLYDFLEARSDGSSFARHTGRAKSVTLATSAVAALVGAGLYTLHPDLPFYANGVLAAAGLPILVALPTTAAEDSTSLSVRAVLQVLREQLRRPEVRWIVLYAALFNVLFSATRWLEQPALETVGVPLVAFGGLYATFKLVTASATMTTGWIQEHLGARRFFLLLLPISALAYGAIALLPLAVLPVIYLRRILDSVSTPMLNQYLNDRIESAERATVLSSASMALSLASALANASFGQVAETTGPVTFLPIAGVVVVVGAGMLWVTVSPVRSGEASTTDGASTGAAAD